MRALVQEWAGQPENAFVRRQTDVGQQLLGLRAAPEDRPWRLPGRHLDQAGDNADRTQMRFDAQGHDKSIQRLTSE
jgi:hypothetical protein